MLYCIYNMKLLLKRIFTLDMVNTILVRLNVAIVTNFYYQLQS